MKYILIIYFVGIDNISFLSPPMSKPMQYEYDDNPAEIKDNNEVGENTEMKFESEQTKYSDQDHEEEEENNIIPWKKLLRKTNSRLTAT